MMLRPSDRSASSKPNAQSAASSLSKAPAPQVPMASIIPSASKVADRGAPDEVAANLGDEERGGCPTIRTATSAPEELQAPQVRGPWLSVAKVEEEAEAVR